jgi:hypothetical protein
MTRKKSRPASTSPASTAVMPEPARMAPPHPKPGAIPYMPHVSVPFRQTPLGTFLLRLFRAAASLQLAICLLSTFTLCLIIATFLESWYNASIAQELIYHTWWFFLLLTLLATNILCAALK